MLLSIISFFNWYKHQKQINHDQNDNTDEDQNLNNELDRIIKRAKTENEALQGVLDKMKIKQELQTKARFL